MLCLVDLSSTSLVFVLSPLSVDLRLCSNDLREAVRSVTSSSGRLETPPRLAERSTCISTLTKVRQTLFTCDFLRFFAIRLAIFRPSAFLSLNDRRQEHHRIDMPRQHRQKQHAAIPPQASTHHALPPSGAAGPSCVPSNFIPIPPPSGCRWCPQFSSYP